MVGLAQQKNYISVYVSAVEGDEYLSEKYGPDLGKVKVGKSSISFKTTQDIDMDKLVALILRGQEGFLRLKAEHDLRLSGAVFDHKPLSGRDSQ